MKTITESIVEDGKETVVAQWQHEHIMDLAKKIASLPQNHDELEIVIADLIKRFVHQEKASVYSRLEMYVKDLGFLFEKEEEKEFFNEKIDLIIGLKAKSHDELSKKWEYGTKSSVAEHIARPPFAQLLKDLLNEKCGGCYTAGSLSLDDYVFNSEFVRKAGSERRWEYNPIEKYLWSKLYVKHKTPTHSFYKDSKDYVEACESQEGFKQANGSIFRVSL